MEFISVLAYATFPSTVPLSYEDPSSPTLYAPMLSSAYDYLHKDVRISHESRYVLLEMAIPRS